MTRYLDDDETGYVRIHFARVCVVIPPLLHRLHQESIEIWKEACTEDHPGTSVALQLLGRVYEEHGEHAKALEIRKEVLASKVKILGEDHPFTAAAYEDLAESLEALGRLEEAVKARRQGREIRYRIHGSIGGTPRDVTAIRRFAQLLDRVGENEEAGKMRQVAEAIEAGTCSPPA